MQMEHLQRELEKYGYQRIPSNVEQISLFFRIEERQAMGVCLIDDRSQVLGENGMFETVMQKTELLLEGKAQACRVLGLIVTEHMEQEKRRQNSRYNFWLIDTTLKQRIVFENQPGHFFGLEQIVDQVLEKERGESGQGTTWAKQDAERGKENVHTRKNGWNGRFRRTYTSGNVQPWSRYAFSVNTMIVLVNVLLFLWMSLSSENSSLWLYRHGAIQVAEFIADPQWWRLLASAFLHFSFSHLFGNMVVLWYIGNFLEQLIGWWRYLLLYLAVAVGANVLSVAWYWYTYDWNVLTAGASGAIFGVVGMMLYIVIRERGHIQGVTIQQMVLMVIFTLYTGFANSGVNNSAHVGGLMVGFLCGLLFYRGPVRDGGRRFWAGKR